MQTGLTLEQNQQLGRIMAEKFRSNDERLIKEGAVDLDRMLKQTFKENSYKDKILEPKQLNPATDFFPSLTSEKPQVLFEVEPSAVGAVTVPFNTNSPMATFGAKRFTIGIQRVKTPRLSKEVLELTNWSIALQDILADFQHKAIINKLDGAFTLSNKLAVGVQPGTIMPGTGSIQHHKVIGGITSDSMAQSLKYIPRIGPDENALNSTTCLMNVVTSKEFARLKYFEVGPLATDIYRNGIQEVTNGALGLRFILTIKHQFVPDGVVYHYSDPRYIGRSYVLTEPTLIVKQHDHAVSFYQFWEGCGGIFFGKGLAMVEYTDV
jgi:hypothetical protein